MCMQHFVKHVFSRSCWKANFSTSKRQPSPFFRLLPCSVPFSLGMNLRVLDCVRAPAATTCLLDISFQPSFASIVAVEVFEPAKSHYPFMLSSAIKNEPAVLDILLRCKYDMHQRTHHGFAKACFDQKKNWTHLPIFPKARISFSVLPPKDFPTDDRFPINASHQWSTTIDLLPHIATVQPLISCYFMFKVTMWLRLHVGHLRKKMPIGLDGYGLRAGDILNVIMCIYI